MNTETPALALIRPVDAATRLGFDVTSKNWRISFRRFYRRHRLPFVRLSVRRFRFRPEVIDAFVASREVGKLRKAS